MHITYLKIANCKEFNENEVEFRASKNYLIGRGGVRKTRYVKFLSNICKFFAIIHDANKFKNASDYNIDYDFEIKISINPDTECHYIYDNKEKTLIHKLLYGNVNTTSITRNFNQTSYVAKCDDF